MASFGSGSYAGSSMTHDAVIARCRAKSYYHTETGGVNLDLHKCLLTENDCYKAGRKIVPKGVMVHSTGANNPNLRRYVGPDDGLLARIQTATTGI